MKLNAALLFVVFILLCCLIKCNWTKSDKTNNVQSDTIYIQGNSIIRVDTIYTQYRVNDPKPVKTFVIDSLHSEGSSTLCDSIRSYTESLDDSSGLVVVESTVQGVLLDQKINLQSYVTSTFRVDTLKITKTETKFRPTCAGFLTMQFDSLGYVKPAVGFQYGRKRVSYSGSINIKGQGTLGLYYNFAK